MKQGGIFLPEKTRRLPSAVAEMPVGSRVTYGSRHHIDK